MDQNMNPPVEEGREYDVTIEAVGEKGDGIAKVEGFVLFVAGTRQGERKRVRVTKVLQKVGFAEVVGDAGEKPSQQQRQSEPKEEFDPKPELDSEDFGED